MQRESFLNYPEFSDQRTFYWNSNSSLKTGHHLSICESLFSLQGELLYAYTGKCVPCSDVLQICFPLAAAAFVCCQVESWQEHPVQHWLRKNDFIALLSHNNVTLWLHLKLWWTRDRICFGILRQSNCYKQIIHYPLQGQAEGEKLELQGSSSVWWLKQKIENELFCWPAVWEQTNHINK